MQNCLASETIPPHPLQYIQLERCSRALAVLSFLRISRTSFLWRTAPRPRGLLALSGEAAPVHVQVFMQIGDFPVLLKRITKWKKQLALCLG